MLARLLVCGDKSQDVDAIVGLLGQESYQVEVSLQPFDALQKLATSNFNALILSVRAGDSAWLTVISLINTLHAGLPLIVVTDDASLETERAARKGRIFYYLMKPIEEPELKIVVKDAIRKSRSIG
ncbi:MAG: response regulator [Acidobacteria bacterium]|nr:response regulator [Acidobacteriota bacterium]MBI3655469.1 response regulator [Acidobacteriota bacterium]